jgi:isocitrate lyase
MEHSTKKDAGEMGSRAAEEDALYDHQAEEIKQRFASPRFEGIERLYSAQQVMRQQGTITRDYSVARQAAEAFYARLRQLNEAGESITTFGPYSPGQAVVMKRVGIEGIYLGGWATSAKGSINEDPGADLASYPLSQVPDEAAPIVRALLTADKNQHYLRSRMSQQERASTPQVDYRPFIIADADTGHGGDAHVRNLVRRFVEVGVPGYHIEDQKPGVKKCGHQGGKVLVPMDEQIKRLNAARFQLDVMGVSGIIVARTDAEAATLLDGRGDERDHAFVQGATNVRIPPWKRCYLALIRHFYQQGLEELNGHLLYRISDGAYEEAEAWLQRVGVIDLAAELVANKAQNPGQMLDQAANRFVELWEAEAGLMTYGQAVAEAMAFHIDEGQEFELSTEQWLAWSSEASFSEARARARDMGLNVVWDPELPRTPEGYYVIKGGIDYAIARSLAVAPFADIIWMETKTANLAYARRFAEAVHAVHPGKMLAYNLSPSFNWDTTGMSDQEMTDFPAELGKLGFVFNFITYGGHQVDGMAAEEFATGLQQEGMLALAKLQRKLRLVESPYRTPQTLVGGPRLDGALTASSGRTATTKAMGKGSTQTQHLVQTEVPPRLLEEWLELWCMEHNIEGPIKVKLRPHVAGSELLNLDLHDRTGKLAAQVVFATIQDRRGRKILSIRDQETIEPTLRQKRLMTLAHLFLFHRYKVKDVHYVSPTDHNQKQAEGMKALGFYSRVASEVGFIIVAQINETYIDALLNPDRAALKKLIAKS